MALQESDPIYDPEDGLIVSEVGPWWKDKLRYLEHYVSQLTTAMKGKWDELVYIDLFSGPGKCKIRNREEFILGSPLRALHARDPFDRYFFVDINPEYTRALTERCRASERSSSVQIIPDDSNLVVDTILAQIPPYPARKVLCFAFLDPEGLELKWSTVEKLGRHRIDLLVNFSSSGIKRTIGKLSKLEYTLLDEFFGCEDWRRCCDQKTGKAPAWRLLDLYQKRLRDLGYKEFVSSDVIRSESRRLPLYYLLFASKHGLGKKFAKQSMRKDLHGQLKLFDVNGQ